jgi:hypothetical protein
MGANEDVLRRNIRRQVENGLPPVKSLVALLAPTAFCATLLAADVKTTEAGDPSQNLGKPPVVQGVESEDHESNGRSIALDTDIDHAITDARTKGDVRALQILSRACRSYFEGQTLAQIRAKAHEQSWIQVDAGVTESARFEVRKSLGNGYPDCQLYLRVFKDSNSEETSISPILILEFNKPYTTVRRNLAFPRHSVLGRVIRLNDLRKLAVKAPYLRTMEVTYGEMFWVNDPLDGYTFSFKCDLDSGGPGKMIAASFSYQAYSGLDPMKIDGQLVDLGKENGAVVVPEPYESRFLPEPGETPVFYILGSDFGTSHSRATSK